MTSIPASRSARAMTFAPRSWPSRPGFAITTRILFVIQQLNTRDSSLGILHVALRSSDDCFLRPFPPPFPQHIAHFSERGVRANGIEDWRHQVVRSGGCAAHRLERAAPLPRGAACLG